MKRNITLIYIISSLMWGRFFIPVIALFYIASEVSLNQFTIIMAVFALSTLLLEIPSGVIADILGKKKTLLISRFIYIIEITILAFFNSFWPFLIAKIISGIGVSLSSGTSESLLYDTLKKLNKEKEHKKISGHLYMITNISMGITFIVGAFLFSLNNKLPAFASLPLITLGFLLTFLIKEPYDSNKKLTLKNSLNHFKEGFDYFIKNKYVKFLIFYSLPIATIISIILSISSIYFEKISIPIALIGTIAFISTLTTAYAAKKSYIVEEKLGQRDSLILIQITILLALIFMSFMFKYFGVTFYLIITLTSGFFSVIINHYTNKHIETSHRATMLSIKNFFSNFGIFLIFPIVGKIESSYNLGFSLKCLAAFLIIYFIIFAIYNLRKN